MATRDDLEFRQLVLDNKLASIENIQECIQSVEQYAEVGIIKPLATVLLEKHYLTDMQVSNLRKLQGKEDIYFIKGYTILQKLGQGGLGSVYKARQDSIGGIVALKILASCWTEKIDYVKRFMQEAKISAELQHNNIVRGLDFGEYLGRYYFAMEFVDGITLKQHIEQKGMIPEKEAIDMIVQVAEALKYAATKSLIHRDIKPENIMLPYTGGVKLCDLGLAKNINHEKDVTVQKGLLMGTPYYISPEQAVGSEDIDIRSDIYSLGITLFEMLTSQVPFHGDTAMSIAMKHISERPSSPRSINNKLSLEICAIVAKMIEKDKRDRYSNYQDLINDLNNLRYGKLSTTKIIDALIQEEIASNASTRKIEESEQQIIIDTDTDTVYNNGNKSTVIVKEIKNASAESQPRILVSCNDVTVKCTKDDVQQCHKKYQKNFILKIIYGSCAGLIVLIVLILLLVISIKTKDSKKTNYNSSEDTTAIIIDQDLLIAKETYEKQKESLVVNEEIFLNDMKYISYEKGSFWLDCYTVTNEQYKQFCDMTHHEYPTHWSKEGYSDGLENYPVVNVTYYDAELYAQWAKKRLPTVEEWEAAFGSHKYPWGDIWKVNKCNCTYDKVIGVPEEVKKREPFHNLYNMAGNVWEWTSSPYDPMNKKLDYSVNNIIKGGSYLSDPRCVERDYRDGFRVNQKRHDIGFRCVSDDLK